LLDRNLAIQLKKRLDELQKEEALKKNQEDKEREMGESSPYKEGAFASFGRPEGKEEAK